MLRSRAAVCFAVLASVPATYGATIHWTANANGSWAAGTNWSSNPAIPGSADDVVLDSTLYTTLGRTISLNGNRTIRSLKTTNSVAGTGRTFTISPGTPTDSKLTILTGNISVDVPETSTYAGNSSVVNLTNTPVLLGDGVTPVEATWDFKVLNLSGAAKANATITLGEVIGIAGTKVTVTGSNNPAGTGTGGSFLNLTKANNAWHGQLTVNSGPVVEINSSADNTFGSSSASVETLTPTLFLFSGTTGQAAPVKLQSAGDTYLSATTSGGVVTFNGNLSGASNLLLNKRNSSSSTVYRGTVVVAGSNNTVSGNVTLLGGSLRVNGTWTGAGDVLIYQQYASAGEGTAYRLEGNGNLALAPDKSVTFRGNDHQLATVGGADAVAAPGTDGTVGTLTLDTSGTGKVWFHHRSILKIDLDGATADKLVIDGNVDFTLSGTALSAGNRLIFNQLSAPTSLEYVLMSWTGTRTGEFSGISGVPEGYEVVIRGNELVLVPEPASLAGLMLAGAGLLARRTRRSR